MRVGCCGGIEEEEEGVAKDQIRLGEATGFGQERGRRAIVNEICKIWGEPKLS